MTFAPTPQDGSPSPIPMSSAVPDGTNTPLAIEGGPSINTGGNLLVPVSIYVKDGNDVTKGTQADAAWSGSGSGSEIAILKKIVAELGATLTVTASGNFNNASVSATGSAVPASGIYIAANKGGNLTGLSLDGSGNLNVNLAAGGGSGGTALSDDAAFTAGSTSFTPAGGVYNDSIANATSGHADVVRLTQKRAFHSNLRDSSGNELLGSKTSANSVPVVIASDQGSFTVTANIGTTNGLALDATVAKLTIAQGTALGSNTGAMVQGSVTTNAPSYTTGQISPLSLDTSGLLRISLKDTPANTNKFLVTPDSVALPLHQSVNVDQLNGTTTDTNSGNKSAGTLRVVLATDQPALTNALKVDGSAVTQPVSGTITANIGTTNGLALDTSVNGLLVSQGSTTSGEKGPMVQGAVTTNAPSYTTAQTSPISLDTSGLLRVSLKDTPTNTNNFNVNIAASAATVTVSGTVTANQGGSNWSTNVAQIGGTNIVTGGASGLIAVGGPVASGASNADNPVKVGGVFNTTQPTVTNGQIVDAQATARGAIIVATGVDTLSVTETNSASILAALDDGQETMANSLSVVIASDQSNVSTNVAQFGGTNISTGAGAGGAGIARVTVSNDSEIQLWDGTTGPVAVKAASTAPALIDKALVMAISPNNSGLPVNLPAIVQSTHAVTGAGGKTLNIAFGSNNLKGNSIVVLLGMGEVEIGGGSPITLTVTDSQSNTYTEAIKASQSTTLEAAIFYATGIPAGANTVTITIAGSGSSNTAIGAEIYEVSGLIANTPGALDATGTSSNAGSTSVSTSALSPIIPNEYVFTAIAAGGGTITAGTNWALDSGSLSPTGGNLVSFGAESQLYTTTASLAPAATLGASNAWAAAAASFKTVILPVIAGSGGGGSNASVSASGAAVPSSATYIGGNKAGNLTGLSLDGSGNLNVNLAAGGGSGGTALADDSVFTAGTTSFTPAGGVYNDSIANATSGHTDTVRITQKRAFHSNLRDSSGNELLGSKTSANSVPVVIASDQGSFTVTANIGTTNGLALDTSVNGLLVAQGSTTSGEKGPMVQGAVTTNAPSYTTAQTSPISLDTSGLLRISLKDTPANTNKFLVTPDSVALPAHQSVNVDQLNGTTTDTNSGNKSAGTLRVVLATDQPALTNALTVNQGGAPWSDNITQVGGSAISLGSRHQPIVSRSWLPLTRGLLLSSMGTSWMPVIAPRQRSPQIVSLQERVFPHSTTAPSPSRYLLIRRVRLVACRWSRVRITPTGISSIPLVLWPPPPLIRSSTSLDSTTAWSIPMVVQVRAPSACKPSS